MKRIIKIALLIAGFSFLYNHAFKVNRFNDEQYQSTFYLDTIKVPQVLVEHFNLKPRDTTSYKGKWVDVETQ